ncbi:MAG: C-GCAxxG-C-C family protein [Thermodesulfobacteriota bacterium]
MTDTKTRSTEERIKTALQRFEEGYHCSQSVFEAFALDFGLDPLLARRISAPLAGGSGVGGECGAVSSGYIVLGLRYGRTVPGVGDEQDVLLFGKILQYVKAFEARHGSLTCRGLLGVDVFTEEGRKKAYENDLFATRCTRHVTDAVVFLEGLLAS